MTARRLPLLWSSWMSSLVVSRSRMMSRSQLSRSQLSRSRVMPRSARNTSEMSTSAAGKRHTGCHLQAVSDRAGQPLPGRRRRHVRHRASVDPTAGSARTHRGGLHSGRGRQRQRNRGLAEVDEVAADALDCGGIDRLVKYNSPHVGATSERDTEQSAVPRPRARRCAARRSHPQLLIVAASQRDILAKRDAALITAARCRVHARHHLIRRRFAVDQKRRIGQREEGAGCVVKDVGNASRSEDIEGGRVCASFTRLA